MPQIHTVREHDTEDKNRFDFSKIEIHCILHCVLHGEARLEGRYWLFNRKDRTCTHSVSFNDL